MKELVINNHYGGFSLSHRGILRYAELTGLTLYPRIDDIDKRVRPDVTFDNAFFVHYYTVPVDEFNRQADEDRKRGDFAKSSELYFNDHGIPRDDINLIRVVKELGEKSWGKCAQLAIVAIPDDVEWEIEEYDGWEHVAEKHRVWYAED